MYNKLSLKKKQKKIKMKNLTKFTHQGKDKQHTLYYNQKLGILMSRILSSTMWGLPLFIMFLLLTVISCNGNGGGSDSYGETYTPPAGINNDNSNDNNKINATDILNMSNDGDIEGLIRMFSGSSSGGSDTAQTNTVIIRAADIGLPAGGTVTLTISGDGIDYTATASADADGNVSYEIPAILASTEITASLQVMNSTGTVLYAGSSTQTVTGDITQIQISLSASATEDVNIVDIANLASFLSNLGETSITNPAKILITGLDTSNWTQIKTILQSNSSKYVDLSPTTLPEGITDMEEGFKNCRNMVKAPKLPSTVTSLRNCFEDCKNLTETPDFSACANLQNLRYAFRDCDKLASASAIPASVTNMLGCFQGCPVLTGTIIVNTTSVSEYNWRDAFLSVPAANGVIVKVKNDDTKQRIEADVNKNGSVTVELQ